MPFPLPTPEELTRRQEALMEQALLAARPDASPQAVARAVRSPRGVLAAIVRVNAMTLYEAHLHLAWWGRQYFPDTAEVEQLERHGAIWSVYRRPPAIATGGADFIGQPGVVIPEQLALRSVLGIAYATTGGGTITAEGTVALAVAAVEAGEDGNAPAGAILTPDETLPGLTQVVVGAEGVAGGAARESDAGLIARILDRIRAPAHGGSADDYRRWVQDAFAAPHVRAVPFVGGVTVAVAMGTAAAPRAPNESEIAAIAAVLDGLRPVGMADFFVVPAVLRAVDCRVVLDPDDAGTRGNVAAALAAFFARDAAIGTTVRRSRLSEAVSAAAGEYSHELLLPAADVICAPTELPVLGDILWGAA